MMRTGKVIAAAALATLLSACSLDLGGGPPPDLYTLSPKSTFAADLPKVDWQLVSYGNAVHSFTNFTIPEGTPGPVAYNKKADQRSWVAMQDFFKEVLN